MPRIPLIEAKEQLPVEQRSVWDDILASRGRVAGPWPVLLHVPAIAGMVAHLGSLVRFDLPFDARVREFTIMATVRELRCEFEWAAHVAVGRQAGVREEAIAALRAGTAPEGLTAEEAELVAYVQQVVRNHRVDDDTFQALERRLGRVELVELTGLIGYYCLIATVLDAFEVPPPQGGDRMA